MTEFNFSQVTQSIEAGDVQGAQDALNSAFTEDAVSVGTAKLTAKYNSKDDALVSVYSFKVTEPGFSLGIIMISVLNAQGQLVGVDFAVLNVNKNNVTYLGLEILTGLASKYKGQTLTVRTGAFAVDKNKKGGISAEAKVTIN